MYIGNIVLLILNLPLVGVFASILRMPQHLLMGFILLLCLIGTYSVNNSFLDIYMLIGMGFLGYFLRKLNFNPAPVILGLVLGPMLENSLRESLYLSRGSFWAIISRPIPAILFAVAIAIILIPFFVRIIKRSQRKSSSA